MNKEQLLHILNLALKTETNYISGMEFVDLEIVNGNLVARSTPVLIGGKESLELDTYNRVLQSFIKVN